MPSDFQVPGFIPMRQYIDVIAATNYLISLNIPNFNGDNIIIQQANNGMSNPTYLLFSPGYRKLIIRKKPPGKLLPGAHQIEREYRVMSALKKSNVPCPEVHALCEDESILGRSFYVMDYVEGRVIDTDEMLLLPPEDRYAIYDQLNIIMASLHTLNFEEIGLSKHGKSGNYAKRQLRTWGRQFRLGLPTIKESNHEFAATLLQASSKFENVIERLRCFVDSGSVSDVTQLVHGDFRLGNVILDLKEAKVVAVLDWEISTLGHPLLDLAYLMMPWYIPGGFLRNFKKIKEGQILPKGLLNEMDYVALYCQRRNIPMVEKEEWTFWKALTCFRLAAINHGVYARGVGGNAGSNKAVLSGPSCLVLINSAEGMLNELENSMGVGGNKLGAKL